MTSEAQKRFLRKRHAQMKEEETCCDCPGCKTCRGFVRNCTCDHDMEWYSLKYGKTRVQGMADHGTSESTGTTQAPGHVDQKDFERFGF